MGALHEGHLVADRAARARSATRSSSRCSSTRRSSTTPATSPPTRATRTRDAALAAEAGADLLFAPPVEEVYPPGFATTVARRAALTEPLEGAHRGAEHFDGVATVVTKLLNMVGPDVAYFGQKDAQQALVIRRLVRDLDMPVAHRGRARPCASPTASRCPAATCACSGDDRERALALQPRAATAAEAAVAAGERDAAARRAPRARRHARASASSPSTSRSSTPTTLAPVRGDRRRRRSLAVAARVGDVRLIDNTLISARTRRH